MSIRSYARALITAAVFTVGAAVQAAPVPIFGSVNMMGNAVPVPTSFLWSTSVGLIAPAGWTVTGSSGALAAGAGTAVSFFAFNWIPPSVGATIYSYTASSGITFTLTLSSVGLITPGTTPDSISVSGTGLLTASDPTMFSPTSASWNFTGTIAAQGRDVSFNTIAQPGRVPEPGTLALIGIGLGVLALSRRRAPS